LFTEIVYGVSRAVVALQAVLRCTVDAVRTGWALFALALGSHILVVARVALQSSVGTQRTVLVVRAAARNVLENTVGGSDAGGNGAGWLCETCSCTHEARWANETVVDARCSLLIREVACSASSGS